MPQDTATEKHERPIIRDRRYWHRMLTGLLGTPTNENLDKVVQLIMTHGELQFTLGYARAVTEIGKKIERDTSTEIDQKKTDL